ncbi:MAG: hypothetical protein QOJ09_2212 [Actinomycetota bacterium]|nr:hypothetical protein [Actinomycetota bacterium]
MRAVALAVFFLLLGVFFGELSLVGWRWAMLAGAGSLALCALILGALRSIYAKRPPRAARRASRPSSSVTALRST